MSASGTSAGPVPPFFVVGAQRSGSTLLRLMLDHHPAISCPHEIDYVVARVGPRGELPELRAYARFLETQGSFRRSGLRVEPGLDYLELADSFLRQHSRGKPVLGMTVHLHLDRLLHIWPEARFIHLLRDPRDVARSVVARGWCGNAWVGVERWIEAEEQWERLRDALAPERWTEIRYEDLLRSPERELRRLCAFLGLPWDAAMLSYPEDSTYPAPDAALAEQWRSRAQPEEIRLAEARVGRLLEQRGYPRSELPPLRVGWARSWGLRAQDRLGRFRVRARRFGLPLVVADLVLRRLRLDRLHLPVRRRMREIGERFIQ